MDEDGKYWDFRIHGNLRGPPPNATPLQGIRVLALGGAPLDSHERCSQVSPLSKKHRSLKKQQQVYLKKSECLEDEVMFFFFILLCVSIFFSQLGVVPEVGSSKELRFFLAECWGRDLWL